MGKLIITGSTREVALARARRALAEFRIEGVPSVLPFHRAVLEEPAFTGEQGFNIHTRWIETDFSARFDSAPAAVLAPPAEMLRLPIEIDGRRLELRLPSALLGNFQATTASDPSAPAAQAEEAGPDAVHAPVTGTVQIWRIEDGAEVTKGDVLAVMEAMKMETTVLAHSSGRLQRIAEAGSVQTMDAIIARIKT